MPITCCTRCGHENREDAQHCTECGGFLGSTQEAPHPLYFRGELTEPLNPLLFGLKPLVLVPHYVALGFLWAGFTLSWLASLFAIIVTGKYPRRLFEFNLGVLRWSWRVDFYGIGVRGTDRYPAFTLKSSDYPADLDIPYPESLSGRLAIMKLFLLVFFWIYLAARWSVLHFYMSIMALIIFFSLKYPKDSFDVLLGFSRWTYQMEAYIALMTDRFPHLRFGEQTAGDKSIEEFHVSASSQERPDDKDFFPDYADVQPDMVNITDMSAVKYAGFRQRIIAFCIDMTVIMAAIYVITFIVNHAFIAIHALNPEEDNSYIVLVVNCLVLIIAGWLYYALMESSSRQTTLGKLVVGVIVTDDQGRKISFNRATARYFSKFISLLILFIGYLMVPFTKKKQGLHDMIAHTLVVRNVGQPK